MEWGKGARGKKSPRDREEEGGGGLGVGSVPTVTVTLVQTLFAVVKRRIMKTPT